MIDRQTINILVTKGFIKTESSLAPLDLNECDDSLRGPTIKMRLKNIKSNWQNVMISFVTNSVLYTVKNILRDFIRWFIRPTVGLFVMWMLVYVSASVLDGKPFKGGAIAATSMALENAEIMSLMCLIVVLYHTFYHLEIGDYTVPAFITLWERTSGNTFQPHNFFVDTKRLVDEVSNKDGILHGYQKLSFTDRFIILADIYDVSEYGTSSDYKNRAAYIYLLKKQCDFLQLNDVAGKSTGEQKAERNRRNVQKHKGHY
ncbi:hypothetical protein K1728_06630 [Weissella confusa]|uniref:hypothetical protein n=1 Tax=Weissella confusa TaxID=1583 RepID=UPI001C6F6782|nr:hypothetical protein [Weissella confusa]QYU56867.1 hypothetical protein K1728_06630 [Weissella confusa]